MKKMKDLQKDQEKLIEELNTLQVQVQKKKQDAEIIANQIIELKEQLDFGSFKFVHANMSTIIQELAPKHKIPKPREISLSSGTDSSTIVASIPWAEEECSDENPCNANICPRCTLIYFKGLLDRILAGYYSK